MREHPLVWVRYVQGFVAGALVSSALFLAACATGGVRSSPGGEPEPPAAPVEAQTSPAAADTPAEPSAPAAPAPGAGSTAATADAAGEGGSPVAEYLADPQAMGRAHQLFRAVCTGYCHSTQPTADRVAPNLFDCAWDHGSTDEAIFQSIAAGIPDTQMQGFGERLPSEDLWKLVAYVRQKSTCQ